MKSLPNLSLTKSQLSTFRINSPNVKSNHTNHFSKDISPKTVSKFKSSSKKLFMRKATINTFPSTSETDNNKNIDTQDSIKINNVFPKKQYVSQLSKISENAKTSKTLIEKKQLIEDYTSTSKEDFSPLFSSENRKKISSKEEDNNTLNKKVKRNTVNNKKNFLNLTPNIKEIKKNKKINNISLCNINTIIQGIKPVIETLTNELKLKKTNSKFINSFHVNELRLSCDYKDNMYKHSLLYMRNKLSINKNSSKKPSQSFTLNQYKFTQTKKSLQSDAYYIYYAMKNIKSKQFDISQKYTVPISISLILVDKYFNFLMEKQIFKNDYLNTELSYYKMTNNFAQHLLSNFSLVPSTRRILNEYFVKRRTMNVADISNHIINLQGRNYKYFNKFLMIDNNEDSMINMSSSNEDRIFNFSATMINRQKSKKKQRRNSIRISNNAAIMEVKSILKKEISLLNSNFLHRKPKNAIEPENEIDPKYKKRNNLIFRMGLSKIAEMQKMQNETSSKDKTLLRTNQIKASLQYNFQTEYEALVYLLNDGNFREFEKQFVQLGMDPNIQDKFGNTFLILAIQLNSFPVINFLLHNGADPNLGNVSLFFNF